MRRAVVLMNLGGPDSLAAVRPFLRNLFSDPAIIGLPTVLRRPLASLIAARRAVVAREIYARLGGASPLLANTEAQAEALEAELGVGQGGRVSTPSAIMGEDWQGVIAPTSRSFRQLHPDPSAPSSTGREGMGQMQSCSVAEYRCFIAMRYWHPLTAATVGDVKAWQPDEVVLLPLYPQFSTTTTGSSLAAWRKEAARQGLGGTTRVVRSYPTAEGFIAALVSSIKDALAAVARDDVPLRLLFSAHGLPLKIVRAGDPYPREVEETAAAVAQALGQGTLDWIVCYQSRVGPLAWLGPSVEDELRRASRDRVAVVVAPISFVSEHSETLVELDRDYRQLAETLGVPGYYRAATVGTDPRFIAALAELVRNAGPDS